MIKKYILKIIGPKQLKLKLRTLGIILKLEPIVRSDNVKLEARLAKTKGEIKSAQQLRFKVFYKELSAHPNILTRFTRKDKDTFDKLCHHMLVIDHAKIKKGVLLTRQKKENVVGTYRLLPQRINKIGGGFYSQDEYSLEALLRRHSEKKFLELGRSCVLKDYRRKSTIELLWQGVWKYIKDNNFDVMIGCASFQAKNPKDIELPLSFLYHNCLAGM